MRVVIAVSFLGCLLLAAFYVGYRIHKSAFLHKRWRRVFSLGVWGSALLLLAALFVGMRLRWQEPLLFTGLSAWFFAAMLSLLLMGGLLGLEDLSYGLRKLYGFLCRKRVFYKGRLLYGWLRRQLGLAADLPVGAVDVVGGAPIARSAFLMRSALCLGALPYLAASYGVLRGAYDYRVYTHRLHVSQLPKAFDGLRIAQISDIHAGSFWQKGVLEAGIELLLAEKPDVIFFTGDLVNALALEMDPYVVLFGRLQAPLGTFSVLGNHDYGDYYSWDSAEAKDRNMQHMYDIHKALGWRLLRNEHVTLSVDHEHLAIIGVENWGRGRFSKYGDLSAAVEGVEVPCRILLSHDPTHWDEQVRRMAPDIALTCSGHTHGFQMGIEAGALRWSPAQYVYEQWAGLYRKGQQYLYVNRGFGFIGFPGRMGISPEITIFELKTSVT